MEAVVLRAFGEPSNFRREWLPDPRPGRGEVLVRVRACGVCYHDVINRRGDLPRTRVPAILGHEVAGEVVELGPDVDELAVGDRVATLQRLSCGACAHCRAGRNSLCKADNRFFGEELPGGYATHLVAPIAGLGRVPDGVPWPIAATTCCTTGTAVHVIRTRGRVRRGETVLVTGASGGVGLQAVQLARHDGARVIAVTTSERKAEALYNAGAEAVIISVDLTFANEVREVTRGAGVDVAIEIVGSAALPHTLRSMAPGGRIVVVGNLEPGSIELNPGLLIVKELELLGAYATTREELGQAFELVGAGATRPWVSDVFPLAQAALAHRRLEERRVAGRIVLQPEA